MTAPPPHRHVFLSGNPGVGKTTLVQKACEALRVAGLGVWGFYTEEVRQGGRRIGFDIVSLAGERGTLARLGCDGGGVPSSHREYRVGQYAVDLVSFEQIALPLLRKPSDPSAGGARVLVLDEIGKMELFSQSFVQGVRRALEIPTTNVLGTIPVPKGKPLALVEEVRGRGDIKLFMVTKENRDSLLPAIVQAVQECK